MDEILTRDINKNLFRDYPCIKRYLSLIYNSPSTINRLITLIHIDYSDDYWYLNLKIGDVIVKQCPVSEETRWNLIKYTMWFEASLGVLTEPVPIIMMESYK